MVYYSAVHCDECCDPKRRAMAGKERQL